MKYIRLFEGFEPQKIKFKNKYYYKIYWLLPTDDRLEKSLNKIHCDETYMDYVLTRPVYSPFTFIGYDGSAYVKYATNRWGWVNYEGTLKCDFYEYDGYEFGGAINIKDYELESNKYNL